MEENIQPHHIMVSIIVYIGCLDVLGCHVEALFLTTGSSCANSFFLTLCWINPFLATRVQKHLKSWQDMLNQRKDLRGSHHRCSQPNAYSGDNSLISSKILNMEVMRNLKTCSKPTSIQNSFTVDGYYAKTIMWSSTTCSYPLEQFLE